MASVPALVADDDPASAPASLNKELPVLAELESVDEEPNWKRLAAGCLPAAGMLPKSDFDSVVPEEAEAPRIKDGTEVGAAEADVLAVDDPILKRPTPSPPPIPLPAAAAPNNDDVAAWSFPDALNMNGALELLPVEALLAYEWHNQTQKKKKTEKER